MESSNSQQQVLTTEVKHDICEYVLSARIQSDILQLELEQKYDTGFWTNSFSSQYIEDLTTKTGSNKKFSEFIALLQNAMKFPGIQMKIDILTYQDLEAMKQKKVQVTNQVPSQQQLVSTQPQQQNQLSASQQLQAQQNTTASLQQQMNSTQQSNSQLNQARMQKRYVILSSVNEVDKVHYPLSLNFEEVKDVDKLKNTIKKLKMELDDVKSSKESLNQSLGGGKDSFFITENQGIKKMNSTNSSINEANVDQLKSENDLLKIKVRRMEEALQQKKGAIEFDEIIKSKFEVESELELVRKESQREIQKLKYTIDQREQELMQKKKDILDLKKELTGSLDSDEAGKRLRAHILKLTEESESELAQSRKQMNGFEKEIEKLNTDIDFYKNTDKKQKNRIKQLEIELETAIKRGTNRGISDRLYSPYNKGNTTTSSAKRSNSVPVKSYSPASRYVKGTNQAQSSSKGPFNTRTTSNEALQNRNKINPSYNYNFKKSNQVGGLYSQNKSNPRSIQSSKQTNNYIRSGPSSNSPKYSQHYSPQNRFTKNTNSNIQRISPGQRAPGSFNRQSPQNRPTKTYNTQKNPSPGSRYNNYMQNNNNLLKKIEGAKQGSGIKKQVPLNQNLNFQGKFSTDLDSRLDRLQNLLNKAKK